MNDSLLVGLEAAHKQGVIHRDVKPANVWLCLNGTVKLLDFGIATAAAASNATVVDMFGSPGYLSPEQIEGREVDARSDIFSAGAVVYEMLTGHHPFEADSPTAVMLKIVNDVPRRIDNRELPAALQTAVARALEKAPDARYARAADFGHDLKTVKASMPNPRETATVIIDRSKLNLPPRSQAPPAAPQPMPPASPAVEPPPPAGGVKWPILVAALAVVLAAIIAWYVLRSA